MKIIERNIEDYTYIFIPFPESQEFMEEYWFEEEACLADYEMFGPACYFIPQFRWLEYQENKINK